MQHQPIVQRVNVTHEWAHMPYQLLITAACTNTGGKMKDSHSRAADRCPFVPRHSLSQVTCFMQLGMLCISFFRVSLLPQCQLTHWGWVMHICVGKLTIIGSDNGLSPGQRQAIIWTNAGILLIGPLGTNFSDILIEIHTFSSRNCIWDCHLWNGGHFVSAPMC